MLVRIGLKNSVDWSKYKMKVVADFSDGQTAWEYCRKEKPDILITDIRMPRMDGMELISHIRQQNQTTRIVVLSCLEEFDLVRKAMSLGVSNYILKLTMTEEEIDEVLGKVRNELDEHEKSAAQETGPVPPSSYELIKEKYMKDFLLYNIYTSDEFEQFVIRSQMRLTPCRLVVCTMELDAYNQLKDKFKDPHGHLIKMTLMNVIGEITTNHKRGEVFHIDEIHFLIVFSFHDQVSELTILSETHMILMTIQKTIQTYFNGSVSYGISSIENGYNHLPKLYTQSLRVLERKFLLGPGQLHMIGEAINLTKVKAKLNEIRQFPSFRALLTPLKQKEYEEYIDLLENGLNREKKIIRVMLFQFIQWINTNTYDNNQNEKTLLFNITEKLEQHDTLPEMLEVVVSYLTQLVEQTNNRMHMSSEIHKAIEYIKQNYSQNISLQQVADHVNLSFSYLSNLFKKELQITFIDYINRYRVERAKELLIGTQLKSYDIAVQVGFSPEYTYFSKVFKKVTGLNPNEYRKQWLSGSQGGL